MVIALPAGQTGALDGSGNAAIWKDRSSFSGAQLGQAAAGRLKPVARQVSAVPGTGS